MHASPEGEVWQWKRVTPQVTNACQQLLHKMGDMRSRCNLLFYDIDTALRASDQLADADVSSIADFDPAAGTGVLVVVGVPDEEVRIGKKHTPRSSPSILGLFLVCHLVWEG